MSPSAKQKNWKCDEQTTKIEQFAKCAAFAINAITSTTGHYSLYIDPHESVFPISLSRCMREHMEITRFNESPVQQQIVTIDQWLVSEGATFETDGMRDSVRKNWQHIKDE